MVRQQPFKNLMGMETEYVIRYHAHSSNTARPSDEKLFKKVAAAFKKMQPLVAASSDDDSYFAANGGGLSFERSLRLNGTGLIEAATPECFSPKDLLASQRAQDQLLAESARQAGGTTAEFVLLKNNRDKNGYTYGCHENYETVFATGVRLKIWQAMVLSLYPFIIVCWIFLFLFAFALIPFSMFLGWVAFKLACLRFPGERRSRLRKKYTWSFDDPGIWAKWNLFWQYAIFVVTIAGPIVVFIAFARWVAYHPIRKHLVRFLVTRPAWSGAGWLDKKNKFHLQQKPAKWLVGEGVICHRPIIHIAHLVEILIVNPLNVRRYKTLLNPRQRLQISFSDSNMCEEAEYLKLATTRLLLDAIESGYLDRSPRIWRLLAASRKVGRGVLKKKIATMDSESLDAIGVQRYFFRQLKRYVEAHELGNEETDDLFQRWDAILNGLDMDRQSLVGRVDWVTKRFLLDELDPGLSLEARRKVDLKYHELSDEGYFYRLAETGLIQTIVTEAEIDRAKRLPPAGTRAAIRGRYIREFAETKREIKMDWDSIIIGKGKTKQIIELPREEGERE